MSVTNSEKRAVAAILRGFGDSERNMILRGADRFSSKELGVAAAFDIGDKRFNYYPNCGAEVVE